MVIRTLILGIVLVGCLSLSAEDPAKKVTVNDLGWLAGSWSGTVNGITTEETWLAPKGGNMLGVNRTTGGKATAFEFMRIAEGKTGLAYFAQPSGKPSTEFPMKEFTGKKVVFENKEHDFPQRVIYQLTADGELHARIEGEINGKSRSMEWKWKPVSTTK
jgi:hypothetical protein